MRCDTIQSYKGSKSEIIMELVNEQLRKDEQKFIKQYSSDKILKQLFKDHDKALADMKKFKTAMDKRKIELGIKWTYVGETKDGSSKYGYIIDMGCRVPCNIKKKLQKASDYQALGRLKEARAIWNNIMEKYNI